MHTHSLRRYLLRRLGLAGLLVFFAASLAFVLTHLAPGDALTLQAGPGVSPQFLAQQRAALGLDRPLVVQYGRWLSRVIRLDLGDSTRYRRPVSDLLGARVRNTAVLALPALIVATVFGVGLGSVTASSSSRAARQLLSGVSMAAISVPPLVVSLLLVVAAIRTGWFPAGGMTAAGLEGAGLGARFVDLVHHAALPALALALPLTATIERLQSQSMSETLCLPYVRAAVARGVTPTRVVWCYALPVAIRPVLGVYGLILGSVLSGSFIVEYIAAWPGLGLLTYDALLARDVYLAAGCALTAACCLALGTLVSDLALFAADPRLRAA